MEVDILKRTVLNSVVDHVKRHYNVLKEGTTEVPGFHEFILPKFAAIVEALEEGARELNESFDLDTYHEFHVNLKKGVASEIVELDEKRFIPTINEVTPEGFDETINERLTMFMSSVQEKSKQNEENLVRCAGYLNVLERHLPLVKLDRHLHEMNEKENQYCQGHTQRSAFDKLAAEVSAIVEASEGDIQAAKGRLECTEQAQLPSAASSPPTFKETSPSSQRTSETSSVVVPPLWVSRKEAPSEKSPQRRDRRPQRVTVEQKVLVNVFDDDDDGDMQDRSPPAERGRQFSRQIERPAVLQSGADVTFRQHQPGHKISSPQFGKDPAQNVGAKQRTVSERPEKRLSLGAKVRSRRSLSYNWD